MDVQNRRAYVRRWMEKSLLDELEKKDPKETEDLDLIDDGDN